MHTVPVDSPRHKGKKTEILTTQSSLASGSGVDAALPFGISAKVVAPKHMLQERTSIGKVRGYTMIWRRAGSMSKPRLRRAHPIPHESVKVGNCIVSYRFATSVSSHHEMLKISQGPNIRRRLDIRPIPSATCPSESVLLIWPRSDFSVVFEGYAGGAEHWPR